jgi:hypothetical protein
MPGGHRPGSAPIIVRPDLSGNQAGADLAFVQIDVTKPV